MQIQIGTSGWSYEHWQGILYPFPTPVHDRLSYYVQHFRTVELNSSFYRWPRPATFAYWNKRLPAGFHMSVKAPRGLTHGKKLYAPETWIDRIKAGMHQLVDKRAIVLVQLAPQQVFDYDRLAYFLAQLPTWLRVSVEFRHASWHQEVTFRLLEEYQAAYCIMSGAHLPCILRATADFVYVRLHGPDTQYLYGGSYSDEELGWWAYRIREWAGQGKTVYAYFNNDGAGNALRNALTLQRLVW